MSQFLVLDISKIRYDSNFKSLRTALQCWIFLIKRFIFFSEEHAKYENIDFDVADYKNDIKTAKLIHDGDKIKTLMARWRYPSLSLHGIQGK